MAFTVTEFHDLVRLLEQHPEWRAQLRRLVIPDALVDLPRAVDALAEAQRRTEAALDRLTERMEMGSTKCDGVESMTAGEWGKGEVAGGGRMINETHKVCQALLKADADIRDIIQFGSSVYAENSARDLDLLVTTLKKKDYGVYLDAASECSLPVDVIVRQPGERIGERIAWGVCATGVLLHGNGETFREAKEAMLAMPPTFERARLIFERADDALADAQATTRADTSTTLSTRLKDECYRDAFDKLFDVARIAVMAYLNLVLSRANGTDETRWGELRRRLPRRFSLRFRRIIDTLHIQYAYAGAYPQDRAEQEYHRWRANVARLVDDLEAAVAP